MRSRSGTRWSSASAMGARHVRLGPRDRPLHAALEAGLCTGPGRFAHARHAVLHRLRLGADLAARADLPDRPVFLNYFYLSSSVALVQEEVRPDQRVMSGALLLLVMNFIGLGSDPPGSARRATVSMRSNPTTRCSSHSIRSRPSMALRSCSSSWLARALRREEPQAGGTTDDLRFVVSSPAALALLRPLSVNRFAAMSPRRARPDPIVNAPAGAVQRHEPTATLHVFKGIPFAQPPVGAAALAAADSAARVDGRARRRPSSAPPASSRRPKSRASTPATSMPMSEDCLTLNIWAPADAQNAPVFVWIYGGALSGGASREPLYDGARLPSAASSSCRSTIGSACSAGLRIPSSARNRRRASRATTACSTRSRRCAG